MKQLMWLSLVFSPLMADLSEDIQKVIPSTPIESIFPTEIQGVYGVLLPNQRILYIEPKQKLILFGEIFTHGGVSLTQHHKEQYGTTIPFDSVEELLNVAIPQGEMDNNPYGFIVFTDPDCPYCQKLEGLLKSKKANFWNVYVPLDSIHPYARGKALQAIKKHTGSQEQAEKLLRGGEAMASVIGVTSTPQIIVFDRSSKKPLELIKGFSVEKISHFLKEL